MILVDMKRCEVCGTCAGVCAADAIVIERDTVHVDPDRCIMCYACMAVCPVGAVKEDKEG